MHTRRFRRNVCVWTRPASAPTSSATSSVRADSSLMTMDVRNASVNQQVLVTSQRLDRRYSAARKHCAIMHNVHCLVSVEDEPDPCVLGDALVGSNGRRVSCDAQTACPASHVCNQLSPDSPGVCCERRTGSACHIALQKVMALFLKPSYMYMHSFYLLNDTTLNRSYSRVLTYVRNTLILTEKIMASPTLCSSDVGRWTGWYVRAEL